MEINLKNKTAWVFGASGGIGRAVAIELSRVGASILLIARNKNNLQKVLNELCVNLDQKHDFLSVDMSNTEGLVLALKKHKKTQNADIIINNSGGPKSGLGHLADPSDYSVAFRQHVLSAQAVAQIAIPLMTKGGFGRIVNIISTSVKQPINGLGVSNTIRGAMANWSKTLSSELGQHGITVNNILPGATQTDRLDKLVKSKSEQSGSSIGEIRKKMVSAIPCGRFAEASEIAYMVVFLCSNYANYVNGVNVPIDGGRTKSL